ncbi:hypothetical protein J3F83DRAFT_741775 [Trichoderma novae-zelandiae]
MSTGTTGPPPASSPARSNDANAGPSVTPTAPGRSSSAPEPPPPSSTAPPPPPPPATTTSPTSDPPEKTSTSQSPDPPPSSTPSSTPPPDTTSEAPPSSTKSTPSSTPEPPTSTSSSSPSSSTPTPEQTTTSPDPTTTPPSSNTLPPSTTPTTTDDTTVSVTGSDAVTSLVVVTQTRTPTGTPPSGTTSTSTSTATPNGVAGKDSNGGLDSKAKVAIGVVVPIVAIAILAVIGLFFWKKRRARRAAEAERRKEVEDYAYNPNADPTVPTVGMTGGGGGDSYEMREEGPAGYRGWGSTTLAGSTGRKASTTISGATNGYSDSGPSRGNMSEAALLDNPEGEILGAMGPSAANNRGDVRRGASNASSSYSATGRSDGSDTGAGVAYSASGAGYYDSYGQSPYDAGFGGAGEMPAPPIIRDNPARRSTRVEGPGHFPQQSAGISQNF